MAHSSPGQSPSMRLGVSVRPSSPRASARRLAGSIVTTTVLRPRRAPSSASTAAVVVLPTPPEPQHTMMLRSATRSARRVDAVPVTAAAPASSPISASTTRASVVELGGPSSAVNRNGSRSCGSGRPARPAAPPARPAARSRSRRKRGGGRAAPRPRPAAGRRRRRARRPPAGSASSPATAGYTPLTTMGPRLMPTRSSSENAVSTSLVDRRLLGQRHEHDLARVVVGRAAPARRGPGR